MSFLFIHRTSGERFLFFHKTTWLIWNFEKFEAAAAPRETSIRFSGNFRLVPFANMKINQRKNASVNSEWQTLRACSIESSPPAVEHRVNYTVVKV